ncbi:hypothetical protein BD413DRAFT_466953 [Trametes elegans]|nr:hypothetical protein BD413DRAFT_466953 [Trametes elegans]
METVNIPPRRADDGPGPSRDLPDRPNARGPGGGRDERLPRISGTNNLPVGARKSGYTSDNSAPNHVRSPVDRFRPVDKDYESLPRRPPPGEPDSFDRRPLPPNDMPPPGALRDDRVGRRLSAGQEGPIPARAPEPLVDRPFNSLPPRPRDGNRDNGTSRQSRFGPPGTAPSAPDLEPRIWQTRDEAQSARTHDTRTDDVRTPRGDVRLPRDGPAWEPRSEAPRRWVPDDTYSGPSSREPGPRAHSLERLVRNRPPSPPPPPTVRRYDEPLVEHPVVGKLHPERLRLLDGQVSSGPLDDPDRSRNVRHRRPGRSPERGFYDRGRPADIDRDLPPRPADDVRLPPPRDRSPPPQNGHRPNMKRGGSLLERLTLDSPMHDSGSSLRDRVDLNTHGSNDDVLSSEGMDVDLDGNGLGDDGVKGGGRGAARRRGGKPRRFRRN